MVGQPEPAEQRQERSIVVVVEGSQPEQGLDSGGVPEGVSRAWSLCLEQMESPVDFPLSPNSV